jgi:hypothetical protein
MAAITAADVTVTLNPEDIDRSPDGRIGIRTFPIVQFGDGTTQYVALGVPMPPIGKFGFHFAIKRAYIEQPGNGFIYSFDRPNHKVRIWLGAAAAITVEVANHANIEVPAPTAVVNALGLTMDPHSHDLVLANNASGDPVDMIGSGNNTLVSNTANNWIVPGGVAANGGIANETPTGNLASNAVDVTAGANVANLVHEVTVTGGDIAEAALAEMDADVVLAAATHILPMEMVGR